MPVVKRYAPSRFDLMEDLLTWLDRREGPRLAPIASSGRGARIADERALLAAMSAEELVLHMARRAAGRRPALDELVGLLGFGDAQSQDSGFWYRACEHPRITGGRVELGRMQRVRSFAFWSQEGRLDVSVAFLRRHFGRYGRARYRIAHGRDEDTDFEFCRFRGGELRLLRASTPLHYRSPMDKPGSVGNPSRETVDEALAAAGLDPEGSLLVFDRERRAYRAVPESDATCGSFTFSFDLSGSLGPYRLFWLKRRTLYQPKTAEEKARMREWARSRRDRTVEPE